jgi:hypothetical protein
MPHFLTTPQVFAFKVASFIAYGQPIVRYFDLPGLRFCFAKSRFNDFASRAIFCFYQNARRQLQIFLRKILICAFYFM